MTSSIVLGLVFIDRGDLLVAALIFLITFAGSLGVISLILVKIPSDYFRESHSRDFASHHGPVFRWATKIGKNLLGAILVLLGIVMSLPGVPGQGVLTILLGIMLLDLPGKRRLEQKILKQPKVLEKINSLRKKFSKPPLLLD